MSLTHAYCTLDEAKNAIGISSSDAVDDDYIEQAINAASRQIDGYCGQRFWLDTNVVAREFYVSGDGSALWLSQDDVAGIGSTTGLVVKTDTAANGSYATTLVNGTDFLLLPRNAAAMSPARPYNQLAAGLSGATYGVLPYTSSQRPTVQVTAKWGWPAVPDDVKVACILQAAQLFKAKDAVFGVAGVNDFGALRVRNAMNEIAAGLLDPYRFITVA